jgi:hypothetical protein
LLRCDPWIYYSFPYSGIRTRVISGFGGMGDRFDSIIPPTRIANT